MDAEIAYRRASRDHADAAERVLRGAVEREAHANEALAAATREPVGDAFETAIRGHVEASLTAWYEKIRREYPKIIQHDPGARTPPPGVLNEPILRGLLTALLRDVIMAGVGRRSPDEVAAFVQAAAVCAINFTDGRVMVDAPKIARWLAGAG